MKSTKGLYLSAAVVALALALGGPSTRSNAQQPTAAGISIGDSDLGGVVSGANGPEAGVWVIAETTDLPTKFAKIVVTDDQGRYVLPDLPKANYKRLGARLRPGRFAEGRQRARQDAQSDARSRRPNAAAAARVLSGDLLVFDAEDSGARANSPAPADKGNGIPVVA